jgi:hypothetical protein
MRLKAQRTRTNIQQNYDRSAAASEAAGGLQQQDLCQPGLRI